MNRKSKLKINKGEEFKIAIKDIKDGDTIFYDQYKQALKMLGTIVKTSEIIQEKEQEDRNKNWQSEDYENNIIAFCGERGEGKSSAMCTFIKSLSNIDEEILDDMQIESESIKNTYFDEPIIIDPSQFDNVHNILDIVLAKIYEKFKEDYAEYISSEDEKFFEKFYNKPETFETDTKQANERYINQELKDNSDLFDDLDGKSLDSQQREAIVVDEDAVKVIAGAGSGKTFTIQGKVKYLTEKEMLILVKF